MNNDFIIIIVIMVAIILAFTGICGHQADRITRLENQAELLEDQIKTLEKKCEK